MAMQIEQPESMESTGGKYVDKPGIYHCVIASVDENPTKQDGTPLNGVQFTATVLTGTNPEQKDKQIDVMMWNPSPQDDPKQQEGAKKVQTAFCLATCLIGQFQAGAKAVVEPKDAIGRQIVMKLRWRQKRVEEVNPQTGVVEAKYVDTDKVQLSWSDIYHVDDPWVEKNAVPLDADCLRMIAPPLRKQKVQQANGTSHPGVGAGTISGAVGAAQTATPAVDVADV